VWCIMKKCEKCVVNDVEKELMHNLCPECYNKGYEYVDHIMQQPLEEHHLSEIRQALWEFFIKDLM
jgi:hypothetical protein